MASLSLPPFLQVHMIPVTKGAHNVLARAAQHALRVAGEKAQHAGAILLMAAAITAQLQHIVRCAAETISLIDERLSVAAAPTAIMFEARRVGPQVRPGSGTRWRGVRHSAGSGAHDVALPERSHHMRWVSQPPRAFLHEE